MGELIKVVTQIYVFGPIFFNLYWNDLFYLADFTEVCSFGDKTTFHDCDNNLNNLIKRLEHDVFLAIEWFETNTMKLSKDKCHLRGISMKIFWVEIGDEKFCESAKLKLFRMEIGRNLNFDDLWFHYLRKREEN